MSIAKIIFFPVHLGDSFLCLSVVAEAAVKQLGNSVPDLGSYLVFTNGLANATLIKTVNTDLATSNGKAITANAADFAWAGATVDSEDIHAYLVGSDVNVVKFATDAEGVEQPKVKGIYAYDLTRAEANDGAYTFTFKANSDAREAYLVFTDKTTGEEVGRVALENVVEGENTVTLTKDQLPGESGQVMNWAVNVKGDAITRIVRLNDHYANYTRAAVAIDRSPESAHFGTIYVGERIAKNNAGNGIYESIYLNGAMPPLAFMWLILTTWMAIIPNSLSARAIPMA